MKKSYIYTARTYVYRDASANPVFFCQTETDEQADALFEKFKGYKPNLVLITRESQLIADCKNWGTTMVPKEQWIDPTRQYTCGGKRVIGLQITLHNSIGEEVTYPVSGSIVLKEKPWKTTYTGWSLDGRADVTWCKGDDLKLVKMGDLSDKALTELSYCIQCTDKASGQVGNFVHSGGFMAVSPVFRGLPAFFTWMKNEGIEGGPMGSFEIRRCNHVS